MITMWMTDTSRRLLAFTSVGTLLLGACILRVNANEGKTDAHTKQNIGLCV